MGMSTRSAIFGAGTIVPFECRGDCRSYRLFRPAADEQVFAGRIDLEKDMIPIGGHPHVDRAKLRKYSTAYRGPNQALVEKYLQTIDAR